LPSQFQPLISRGLRTAALPAGSSSRSWGLGPLATEFSLNHCGGKCSFGQPPRRDTGSRCGSGPRRNDGASSFLGQPARSIKVLLKRSGRLDLQPPAAAAAAGRRVSIKRARVSRPKKLSTKGREAGPPISRPATAKPPRPFAAAGKQSGAPCQKAPRSGAAHLQGEGATGSRIAS